MLHGMKDANFKRAASDKIATDAVGPANYDCTRLLVRKLHFGANSH